MMKKPNCPIIALEEHYWDTELEKHYVGLEAGRDPEMLKRLHDLGELRLKEMDEAGIDMQILSHGAPSTQKLTGDDAVALTRRVNDRLHAAVAAHPQRFAAFAALPTSDPKAAADELQRTVSRLGFKGAMIHGRTQDVFHDVQTFWPIYERAQQLDVPIYIHPGPPHPGMIQAYYADYLADFPGLNSAAWGYTIDTANQVVRMILSGLFEAYPNLKILIGHMGESIPFLVDRIDEALKRPGNKPISFKET